LGWCERLFRGTKARRLRLTCERFGSDR
jgi:hypothetical protein